MAAAHTRLAHTISSRFHPAHLVIEALARLAMHAPFDMFAKGLIDACLDGYCTVSVEEPITTDPMFSDVVVEPPSNPARLARRGILGQLAREACVFEPYSKPPTLDDADRCLARVSLLRVARRVHYGLWLISPSAARTVIDEWRLEPRFDAIDGLYSSALRRAPRVIVLTELPRTRSTLMLRLMGRGAVLRDALADVDALPQRAWERQGVLRLLLQLKRELARMTETEAPPEEVVMRYREIAKESDKIIRALRAEGRAEGIAEGITEGEARGEARGVLSGAKSALRTLLASRGLELDARASELLATCDDAQRIHRWIARAATATSADSVFGD